MWGFVVWFVRCLAALGWRLEGLGRMKVQIEGGREIGIGRLWVLARCTVHTRLVEGWRAVGQKSRLEARWLAESYI